jgi:hypothetical protein
MFNSRKIQKLIEVQELTNRKLDSLAVGLKTILESLSTDRRQNQIEYRDFHKLLYGVENKLEELALEVNSVSNEIHQPREKSTLESYFGKSKNIEPSSEDLWEELETPIPNSLYWSPQSPPLNQSDASVSVRAIRFKIPSVVLLRMKELTNDKKNSTSIKKFLLDNDGNVQCNILYNKATKDEEHEYVSISVTMKQYEDVLKALSSINLPLANKMKYFFISHESYNKEIRENLKK